jgi:hypothetical protein
MVKGHTTHLGKKTDERAAARSTLLPNQRWCIGLVGTILDQNVVHIRLHTNAGLSNVNTDSTLFGLLLNSLADAWCAGMMSIH